MFNSLVENIKAVSTISAKVVVGGAGALVGGTTGLVAGVAVGAVYGTISGCKAGTEMAIGAIWPASHSTPEAGEVADEVAGDIRAEIRAIENEMRDLAGPAGKPKKGRGRPRKNQATVDVDFGLVDSQELRDYTAGKTHLRPDPVF